MNLKGLKKKSLCSTVLLPIAVLTLSLGIYAPETNALSNQDISKPSETKTISSSSLKVINEKLEKLRQEANQQLEKGATDVAVKEPLNIQGDELRLTVETDENVNAVRQKNYRAKVENTTPIFGFAHEVAGRFTYEKGKIKSNSYDVYLTGIFYEKSHNTKVEKLDRSVWEIHSRGKFKALKYTPVEYTSLLDIGLYGSGDYRVLKAKIN